MSLSLKPWAKLIIKEKREQEGNSGKRGTRDKQRNRDEHDTMIQWNRETIPPLLTSDQPRTRRKRERGTPYRIETTH
jgi:hypothetical protein